MDFNKGVNMEFDTELKSWFIVQLFDNNQQTDGKHLTIVSQYLWGIVLLDKKKRFIPGSYVSSSEITKIIDDEYVVTLNSTYKLAKNFGEYISLPASARIHLALKLGVSPLLIKQIYNNQVSH